MHQIIPFKFFSVEHAPYPPSNAHGFAMQFPNMEINPSPPPTKAWLSYGYIHIPHGLLQVNLLRQLCIIYIHI